MPKNASPIMNNIIENINMAIYLRSGDRYIARSARATPKKKKAKDTNSWNIPQRAGEFGLNKDLKISPKVILDSFLSILALSP